MSMIVILEDTFIVNRTTTESKIMPKTSDTNLSISENGKNNVEDSDYSDDFDSGRDSCENSRLSIRTKPSSQKIFERSYLPQPKPKKVLKSKKLVKQTTKIVESLTEKAQSQRRLKLHELQNEIQHLTTKQKDLESENKLLKRTQRRQAIALNRYEGHEGELPSLIRSHEEEVRSLREMLRKTTEKQRISERRETEKTNELEKVKLRLFRLQNIVKEQHLDERIALSKRIEGLQTELEIKNKMVSDLKHRVELTEKNYKHQISIQLTRQKESKKRQYELEVKVDKLTVALKEKERELEIRNIYTSRGNENKTPKYLLNDGLTTPKKKNRLKEVIKESDKIDVGGGLNSSNFDFEKISSPREEINELFIGELTKQSETIEIFSTNIESMQNIQILQRNVLPSIDSHVQSRINPLIPTTTQDNPYNLPKLEPLRSQIEDENNSESNSIESFNNNLNLIPDSQDLFNQKTRKVNLMRQLFGEVSSMDETLCYSLSSDFDEKFDFNPRNNANLLPKRRREKSNMISNLPNISDDEISPI